jgi:hypothetical protein
LIKQAFAEVSEARAKQQVLKYSDNEEAEAGKKQCAASR